MTEKHFGSNPKKKKVSTFFWGNILNQNLKKKSLNFFFGGNVLGNPQKSSNFQKNPPKWLYYSHDKKYLKTTVFSWRQKKPQNDCFVLKIKNTPKRLVILEGIFQKKKKQYLFLLGGWLSHKVFQKNWRKCFFCLCKKQGFIALSGCILFIFFFDDT